MGSSNSKKSLAHYGNDFELVIRATKELEYILEHQFGAPGKLGLHDKISASRHNGKPLPKRMVKTMRWLVTIRNKLVHDRDFNAIPKRNEFAKEFDAVLAELETMMKKGATNYTCIIS